MYKNHSTCVNWNFCGISNGNHSSLMVFCWSSRRFISILPNTKSFSIIPLLSMTKISSSLFISSSGTRSNYNIKWKLEMRYNSLFTLCLINPNYFKVYLKCSVVRRIPCFFLRPCLFSFLSCFILHNIQSHVRAWRFRYIHLHKIFRFMNNNF